VFQLSPSLTRHRLRSMAAEAAMLSPIPCKTVRSWPPSPYTPSGINFEELSIPRPFWYGVEDEAAQELHEVLTCNDPTKPLPEWLPALGDRSFSQASTCATSPPLHGFGGMSESSSPECTTPALDEDTRPAPSPSPTLAEPPLCLPGAENKSSWLQARKVFVGGIPQTTDQNALYQMFSKFGKVKKAWLQLENNDRAANGITTTKNHRGFGFVIFHEKLVIDQLLGDMESRFVTCVNDLKLEVKRALGKAKNSEEVPSTGANKKPPRNKATASPASSKTRQSTSFMSASISPGLQTPQGGSWAPTSPLPMPQPGQSASWMPSSVSPISQGYQTWQGLPFQPSMVVAFPFVPPFPVAESGIVQPPLGNNQMLPASTLGSSTATFLQQAQWNFLSGGHRGGFPGNGSDQELMRDLLVKAMHEAMPDHYDD